MEFKRIECYWSEFFGLDMKDFMKPGICVVPHARLAEYNGVLLFRREQTGIIAAPINWIEKLRKKASKLTLSELHQTQTIDFLIGNAVEHVIGPAWQGYAEREDFCPHPSPQVRPLKSEEDILLQELASSGDPQGWEDGGFDGRIDSTFGYFAETGLVAVSRYFKLTPYAAFPGIFTHPAYRGRGYAKATLSAAFQHALDRDLMIVYQTLVANVGSLKLAAFLGCQEYARHVAIRLKE